MTDMRYTAIDFDWKVKKLRIGSCVPWAIALVILAWSGHMFVAAPAGISGVLEWFRK